MPIHITDSCRHCGLAVEPTEPMGAWIHTGLSIYCPGAGRQFTATPRIEVRPLPDRTPDPPMERYAWEHEPAAVPGEPLTAWGTPVRCIDTDEYCPSCERDNREGHYDNCLISPPRSL